MKTKWVIWPLVFGAFVLGSFARADDYRTRIADVQKERSDLKRERYETESIQVPEAIQHSGPRSGSESSRSVQSEPTVRIDREYK